MTHKLSVTPPLFENSAKEILARLADDASPEAVEMRQEAQELVGCFREWMVARPSDPVRHEVVNRLFSLYRRVTDYLLRRA